MAFAVRAGVDGGLGTAAIAGDLLPRRISLAWAVFEWSVPRLLRSLIFGCCLEAFVCKALSSFGVFLTQGCKLPP